MPKAVAKNITESVSADPVVALSKELLAIWDADDGSQEEFKQKPDASIKDDTVAQFRDWREALETLISFTQAGGAEGALVQLAVALDTVNGISTAGEDESALNQIELRLHRLIRSAMRVSSRPFRTWIRRFGRSSRSMRAIRKSFRSGSTVSMVGPIAVVSAVKRKRRPDPVPKPRGRIASAFQ